MAGGSERDNGACVRAALGGDVAAFETLVARYQRQATAVAYRLLSHRDDAMEVVQEAFLQAFDKLSTLSEPSRFGPWVLRIVSNLALNRRRARALRRAVSIERLADEADGHGEWTPPDGHAARPDVEASARELQLRIDQAIDELPAPQREALLLFVRAELPQKEIARMLDISVELVKWHVFMARKALKEKLKDYL